MLQMLLRLETNPVFTQNYQDLETQEKRWILKFEDARRSEGWDTLAPQATSIPTRSYFPSTRPSPPTIHDSPLTGPISTQDLRGNLQTWSLEDELKVMAKVQAYFHVAHKVRIRVPSAMFA